MTKVLVIEDDPQVRLNITNILQIEGYEPSDASDGEQGIEMATRILPDLIICDVKMPRKSGYDVLEALRSKPTTARIPFIFLTACSKPEQLRRGMGLGADDYLFKPFEIKDLLHSVETRLKRHASFQEELERMRQTLSFALPHELRTPLSSILSFLNLMRKRESLPDPDTLVELAGPVHQNAMRLQRLIENYIFYSNLRLKEQLPDNTKFWRQKDVIQTKTFIRGYVEFKADKAGRKTDVHLDLAEATVEFSQYTLLKILEEVLENALKFSPAGTPLEIKTTLENPCFMLMIRDHGRGMSAEQTEQIGGFMQFERPRYEQQGIGLGLAIVQYLVDLNEGQFQISSEPEVGTTVTVRVPVELAEALSA